MYLGRCLLGWFLFYFQTPFYVCLVTMTWRVVVVGGGDGLQIWRFAGNMLNMLSRTADKRWSSSFDVGRGGGVGANNSSP
jgi:hypothetical protein